MPASRHCEHFNRSLTSLVRLDSTCDLKILPNSPKHRSSAASSHHVALRSFIFSVVTIVPAIIYLDWPFWILIFVSSWIDRCRAAFDDIRSAKTRRRHATPVYLHDILCDKSNNRRLGHMFVIYKSRSSILQLRRQHIAVNFVFTWYDGHGHVGLYNDDDDMTKKNYYPLPVV